MSAADVRLAADAVEAHVAGRHLLLLLDFDGTLCEFNPDPQAVWLPDERRAQLHRLGARRDVTIALVTGRRLEDVRSRAALDVPAYYAGLHGLEIESPHERYQHPGVDRARTRLEGVTAAAAPDLAVLPGVFIEDKGLSIVLHYRAAPEHAARAEAALLRHARPWLDAGELRTLRGAFMLELMPNIEWHKGSAVDWIRERVAREHAGAWPLYIGDDVTDEDGFRAVSGVGLSVAASARASGADFAVDGPAEVEALLREIASRVSLSAR